MAKKKFEEISDEEFEEKTKGQKPLLEIKTYEVDDGRVYDIVVNTDCEEEQSQLIKDTIRYLKSILNS